MDPSILLRAKDHHPPPNPVGHPLRDDRIIREKEREIRILKHENALLKGRIQLLQHHLRRFR